MKNLVKWHLRFLPLTKENQSHFLANNDFRQVICKHTSEIASQEMEALVAQKQLRLPLSKVNVEALGRFDAKPIAQCQRRCAPLITSLLRSCTGMENAGDNTEFESDNEEEEMELGDALPQEPPEKSGQLPAAEIVY